VDNHKAQSRTVQSSNLNDISLARDGINVRQDRNHRMNGNGRSSDRQSCASWPRDTDMSELTNEGLPPSLDTEPGGAHVKFKHSNHNPEGIRTVYSHLTTSKFLVTPFNLGQRDEPSRHTSSTYAINDNELNNVYHSVEFRCCR
jgi:hypothetical protein